MKTIGIIGGMSWESTKKYFEWLNQGVNKKLGGLHSAKIRMATVDFEEIEKLQSTGKWDAAGDTLAKEAKDLENAGADFILLATNTMHKVANQISDAIKIPFIHLADATAEEIKNKGLKKVGLIATKYTMEEDFYVGKFAPHNIEVLIPSSTNERENINSIIFNELCKGEIKDSSKKAFKKAAQSLLDNGAEGIILGCTEVNMLISQDDFKEPIFDTTRIHVDKALKLAL